jgi:twitching motility protein PilT
MVLITGPAGCGKSSTLAALLNIVNEERRDHILSIEDPIEVVHPSRRCVVNQRQVSVHTESFARALRAALREDPDVIAIGELRDLETISLAITAAQMGALVFGTLHTNGAINTIDRLVDAFPAEQQSQVRNTLAESLAAVVSQQLIPTVDGKGRVAALEILLRTQGMPNVIREGNTPMLRTIMQGGKKDGMLAMDDSLMALLQGKRISAEAAYSKAIDKSRFEAAAAAEH